MHQGTGTTNRGAGLKTSYFDAQNYYGGHDGGLGANLGASYWDQKHGLPSHRFEMNIHPIFGTNHLQLHRAFRRVGILHPTLFGVEFYANRSASHDHFVPLE